MSQTVIGFDVGQKKIGVAVGQTVTRTAQGVALIVTHNGQPDWVAITQVVEDWQPSQFLVGLPPTADGKRTPLIKQIELFSEELTQRFQLEVSFVNETLTSAEADHRIRSGTSPGRRHAARAVSQKRVRQRDSVAAELIVETWLNDL